MHESIELRDEERTRCEIWTRVMGYHRPVSAFNPGKQSEQAERICFREFAERSDPIRSPSAVHRDSARLPN